MFKNCANFFREFALQKLEDKKSNFIFNLTYAMVWNYLLPITQRETEKVFIEQKFCESV